MDATLDEETLDARYYVNRSLHNSKMQVMRLTHIGKSCSRVFLKIATPKVSEISQEISIMISFS